MGCCNSKAKEPKKSSEAPSNGNNAKVSEKVPSAPAAATPATPIEDNRETDENVGAHTADGNDREARLRQIAAQRARPSKYHCAAAEDDELKPCFEEGYAYRIVRGDTWLFYNDTVDQELHVDYRLGPGSSVEPGDRTTLTTTEDGWQQAHMVVYPLETVPYFTGVVNGYKSSVTLTALSEAYLAEQAAAADEVVTRELHAMQDVVGDETDEEAIVQRCVETNTPYVDIHFLPDYMQLSRPGVDARPMPTVAMMRPTHYLPEDQRDGVNAIRGTVVPESIERGKLGDCWLMCSAAVLAESKTAVPNIFAQSTDEEKAVGAYRVVLSKNGWWRSTVVDSYLPTIGRHPIFACITDDAREMWVSLYQKAYAKVHGSYAAITGGDALQAVQDFSRAPTFRFDKDWENAANDAAAADAMVQRLKSHLADGQVVVLSTPSQSSNTYLSELREADPDTFKSIFAKAGLHLGYTYVVAAIDGDSSSNAYFKLRNPWYGKADLLMSTFGSSKQVDEEDAFERTAEEGCVWMPWNDLVNYFDGGGLIYPRFPATHYGIKGTFSEVQPSVVLEVRVTEPVTVQLILSQPDKRGFPIKSPEARYAPIMLSVSKPEEASSAKHRVHKNTSSDPSKPSETTYNFAVARDVAMEYTFQPDEGPYLVIPRMHSKGVQSGYERPFVVGVIAYAPLDGKMSMVLKQIPAESRVFKNILTFSADELATVESKWQVYSPGALPQDQTSSVVVSLPEQEAKAPTPKASSSSASSDAPSEHAEEASRGSEAEEEPAAAAVSDGDIEVHNREVPDVASADAIDEPAVQAPTPIADEVPPGPTAPDSDDDSEELSTPKDKAPSAKQSTPKEKTPSPKSPAHAETSAREPEGSKDGDTVHTSVNRFAELRVSDSDSDSEL